MRVLSVGFKSVRVELFTLRVAVESIGTVLAGRVELRKDGFRIDPCLDSCVADRPFARVEYPLTMLDDSLDGRKVAVTPRAVELLTDFVVNG